VNDKPALILIGRVAGAFGVRGELRIAAFGSDPMAMVGYRDLKREDGSPALTLTAGRPDKGGLIARAAGVDSKEAADALKGLRLFVARADLPEPEEDEFYLADLIGLEARSPAGEVLGKVKAVHDFGAGDLLEIDPLGGGATWLLPFTVAAVPEVQLATGYLVADRPAEQGS
jgi:16S rRNA processing protein RimM